MKSKLSVRSRPLLSRPGAELQAVIFEKAIEKAEAKIKGEISAEDQDRLVDDYLEKVVA